MSSRREALKTIAASAAVAPVLNAQHEHKSEPLSQIANVKLKPRVFTAHEMKLLAVLTDRIIPPTDTPGAADAGVPSLIDSAASRAPALARKWRKGFALLGPDFIKLPQESQMAALTAMSHRIGPKQDFFRLLKDTTIDLYYTTREGLRVELGWNGNTYLAEFKGCTHPDHQS